MMSALPKTSFDPDIIARRALGVLHFVDAGTGASITDGLSVITRVRNKTIPATPSQRGVHVFHLLPGLNQVALWDGESELDPVPKKYEFKIEVRDSSRRFFPFSFNTKLANWPEAVPFCTDGTELSKKIPLYSVPWRIPRSDYAIIRGTLRVLTSENPAAWALLRVFRKDDNEATAKPVVEGVAGSNGEFMLMFPWPKADPAVLNGPTAPVWTMKIFAWYDESSALVLADTLPDGEDNLPELCTILKQRKAKLLKAKDPLEELPPQVMTPGQTLFLTESEENILYIKTT